MGPRVSDHARPEAAVVDRHAVDWRRNGRGRRAHPRRSVPLRDGQADEQAVDALAFAHGDDEGRRGEAGSLRQVAPDHVSAGREGELEAAVDGGDAEELARVAYAVLVRVDVDLVAA